MGAPWINEDGPGFFDSEGDYVPGANDVAGDPDDRDFFRRYRPESLDDAMLCQQCRASAD